jgi:PTH2 family peptidyl-tRNA hydrolase
MVWLLRRSRIEVFFFFFFFSPFFTDSRSPFPPDTGAYQLARDTNPAALEQWEALGQAKVTLKCPDEPTMRALRDHARSLGLTTYMVCDAGRTQIAAGSRTVLAIGPGPISIIDKVSSHLKLY